MTFEFFRFRFHFRALTRVRFPVGKAGNVIRGGLGLALRGSAAPELLALFRPEAATGRGPSGLADPPRPFVLRASHLDGQSFERGSTFYWDVHAFDLGHPPLAALRHAFERLVEGGFGPGRGCAVLERVAQLDLLDRAQTLQPEDAPPEPLSIDLEEKAQAHGVRLQFVTPTELKGDGGLVERPEFGILFGRLRDRIGILGTLYGRGPLEVDFRAMGERAREVRLVHCALRWRHTERRSGRTGQVHSIGGFTGDAEYAGEVGEFLPWLAAARWVGVGRHTLWGNGDVRIVACGPADRA